ncbi:MAG TPA: PEPxxWA-CTERM sorting domain-containing protein [Sphingomonas sp.]|nr:PEPxxWA-CTERM sorting domain-containing protein [Sphingomonas sp.]
MSRHPAILVDAHGRASDPASRIRLRASSATLAAVLALTLAAPADNLGGSFLSPVRESAAAALAGVAEAIRSRSPGVRGRVVWIKGRPVVVRPRARAAPRGRRPAARASVLPPAAAPPSLVTAPPPAVPLALLGNDIAPGGPVTIGPLPAYDLANPQPVEYVQLPPERGPSIIIGGGPIGGTGPVLPPPRPPAIPEASTWAMMILGFGAIGSLWRRRRLIAAAVMAHIPLRLTHLPLSQ